MEQHVFFLHLLIILLTARVLAEVVGRLRIPPVLGELCAGIILGPSLLALLEPNEVFKLLAEIGVILLLFDVGLETDARRLVAAGPRAALVEVGGFILAFVFGYFAARSLFNLPVLMSLFVGGTLTATSIGITLRAVYSSTATLQSALRSDWRCCRAARSA